MMIGARNPRLAGRIMVVDMLPAPAAMIGGSASGAGALASGLLGSDSGRRLFGSLMSSFSPPNSSLRTSDADVVARAMTELAAIDLTAWLPGIRAPMTIVYASLGPPRRGRARPQFRPRLCRAPAAPASCASTAAATW